jgi:putative FmdB family regulatory protein
MPTYSYQCQKCNHDFEGFHRIADMHLPTTQPCPSCQGEGTVIKTIAGAPAMGDPVRLGIRKIDGGFKEVLQRIHAANGRHSTLNSKW